MNLALGYNIINNNKLLIPKYFKSFCFVLFFFELFFFPTESSDEE